MASFNLSLLSRSCLLALTTGGIPAVANAESPWSVSDGTTLNVTDGYTSSTAKEYPLFATGEGSLLRSDISGLNFNTTGNMLYAASATNGGSIILQDSALATNGTLAHGANLAGGHLEMNGGSITVSGNNSSGVYGSNGATAILDGVAIKVEGNSSAGITLTTGDLSAKDTTIIVGGHDGQGISLAYSTAGEANATLENVNIELQGVGKQAGLMLGNGSVHGNAVNITTSDNNRGVDIYNSGGGHGTMTLNNGSITTKNGDGVYILGGDVTLNDVMVNTDGGIGVNVNKNAQANINGGSITTQKAHADALWIASASASADVSGTTFTTHGAGSHAFNAQYGNATLADSTLITMGTGSYGLYTESEVQGSNLNIATQGDNAVGVYSARGGLINLDKATITASGNSGAGLVAAPSSTINGNELLVSTSGQNSHALSAQNGTFNVRNSQLHTSGKDAAGLNVTASSTNNAASSVTLDNVVMTTQSGPAIKTNGAALELNLKNGTQIMGGNGILLESLAGNLSDPDYNGDVTLTADSQVQLFGDILAAKGNHVNVTLHNTSQLTGAIIGADSLELDDSSAWNLTGNSNLGQLKSDGVVRFQYSSATSSGFSTLSIDSLSGNGTFVMNTDLESLNGDLIAVNGQASGDHILAINNSGREPTKTDDTLTVVTTGGGNADFALNGGAVDAGTYQYELRQHGNDWVLAQKHGSDGKPIPTPTTDTALGLFNATPTAWYGELTTLRTRMGDVRQGEQHGGAWARVLGSQYNVNNRAGVGYQQRQSGISVGVDSAHAISDGTLLAGVFSGVSRSTLDFDHASTGTINSFFIGGYGTWLLDSGWFIDAIAKANNFSNHSDVRMTDGQKSKGNYRVPGFGLSLEVGRQLTFADGWFAEPSAQMSALWVKGKSYTFDNGLEASSGQARSYQTTLSGVFGRNFELDSGISLQPWIRIAAVQEFVDNNPVNINGNHFTNDLSGARGEYGAGISAQVSKSVQLYTDARYSNGEKIESPWSANLGIRWTW